MNFAIVTPAYNEEKCIGKTIESVINQSIKPVKWIIVDDGSTDQTANIVKDYASKFPWIQYVHRVRDPNITYYASNVYALQLGVDSLGETAIDFMAILDADIELPNRYYETINEAFNSDDRLGIASGNCADIIEGKIVTHLYDRRSSAKSIMVLRKACFDQIGGFLPLKHGGEDTCACFTARMHGWKTWAFHELMVIHNKPLGTGASGKILKIRFKQGLCDWSLAAPMVFEILKSIRRCFKEPPLMIGGLARMVGYCYGIFFEKERQISEDLVRYIRKEQLDRVLKGNKIPAEHRVVFKIKPEFNILR